MKTITLFLSFLTLLCTGFVSDNHTRTSIHQPYGLVQIYGLNCGTNTNYYDTEYGWFDDDGYTTSTYTYSNGNAIANTTDDYLYQSERSSEVKPGALEYDIPVEPGSYQVDLHFAEIYYTSSGQRRFDVKIEGVTVLDDYDCYAVVGANYADRYSFNVKCTDGNLDISFDSGSGTGGTGRPTVKAIAVFQRKLVTIN